jgi:hypothetical protein
MIELLLLNGLVDLAEHVTDVEATPPPVEMEVGPTTHYVKVDTVWDRLAECESGNWIDGGASFERGSSRWYWGMPGTDVPPWGTRQFHGGLQFHPDTWAWVAPMVGLGHIEYAYDATREEQILVAEKVQHLQGWGAWPVCSRKVGLR